ncbi:hypothetical protein ACYOEI_09950 [Singulisphaera rosea]
MKRPISIAGLCVVGALIAVPLGCIVTCGLLLLNFAGPSPDSVLANAQPICEPIIVALTEFHRKHGRYPRELAALVKEGFLSELPELPPHWGTSSRYGPTYDVNESLDFYRLCYGYVVEGGIGPGDGFTRSFVSDEPEGWSNDRSESMEDLVAGRLLAIYRERHDGKSLGLFMSDVIGNSDCYYLYRSRVIGWLGEGDKIDLPAGLSGAVEKGYVYQAEDDPGRRYCFVYKDQWLPVSKSYLSSEEKSKCPPEDGSYNSTSVDKNYPVLDKLFLIQHSDGDPIWTIIRECPASPREKPSGRHAILPSEK